MLTRRSFLRTTGLTIGSLGTAPGWLTRAAAQGRGGRKILVAIFQRGAADGLNLVIPFSEKRYYQLRPTLAIPAPGSQNGAIDLDGHFALHPQLQPLKALWDHKQLAIIHAAGSPDASRSHFDAQEFMECGTAGVKTPEGWLNRVLPLPAAGTSPVRAVAMGSKMPRALTGAAGALAVDDSAGFQGSSDAAALLETLYGTTGNRQLNTQGKGTFEVTRLLDSLRKQPYTPANGTQYIGQFGQRLQQLARLIKADVGVEVAFADTEGPDNWDHHFNESSRLPIMAQQFGTSIAAFARDMGDRMADIVLVTMSEFGRTAAENGTGTDHGHGSVMMVLGGPVKGGQVYGQWPGLEKEQLYEGRDLAVTTDFRDVLGELVAVHLGQQPEKVFPGYSVQRRLGLVTG
jgi:uncharacterized protein (DUF1501 family)